MSTSSRRGFFGVLAGLAAGTIAPKPQAAPVMVLDGVAFAKLLVPKIGLQAVKLAVKLPDAEL